MNQKYIWIQHQKFFKILLILTYKSFLWKCICVYPICLYFQNHLSRNRLVNRPSWLRLLIDRSRKTTHNKHSKYYFETNILSVTNRLSLYSPVFRILTECTMSTFHYFFNSSINTFYSFSWNIIYCYFIVLMNVTTIVLPCLGEVIREPEVTILRFILFVPPNKTKQKL